MTTARPRADRRRRLITIWVTAAILAAVTAVVAWIGVRGLLARDELTAALPLAGELKAAIGAADTDVATDAAAELAEHTARAAELTSDPIWRAAEVVPWAGPNLTAVRTIASELDRVADEAVVPLADAAARVGMDSLRPVDGRIDLAPLVAARDEVGPAVDALGAASARIDRVDPDGLISPLADARNDVRDTLHEATQLADALDRGLQLLPAVLGVEGPRDYLVLFQNNAELRTAGGIPGALALIHTDDGTFELAEQASTADLRRASEPVLPLTDADVDLFGVQLGTHIQNVTATPDFTFTGRLAAEFWRQQRGVEVDGVVAVDPVGLSYVLEATGPVTLPNGDVLTSENAARTLMVDVYSRFADDAAQDAYFADASAAVFGALAEGGADPSVLVGALSRAGAEHRIAIWSARPDEQAVLADTTLAGMSATQRAIGGEAYAVYLNDRSGGKMGAFLEVDADAEVADIRDDGRAEVVVTVTLTSTAPLDAATSLPARTTNAGAYGTPPGVVATNVTVYGAAGAFDGGIDRGGTPIGYRSVVVGDHVANNVPVDLAPGESTTLRYRFLSARAGQNAPVVFTTPLMTG